MNRNEFIESEIGQLNQFVIEHFANSQYHTHHLDHLLRVKKSSLIIGRKLDADLTVLEISALFHDIARSDEDSDSCHAELSAEFTR